MTVLPPIENAPPGTSPDLSWSVAASCPPDWHTCLELCGGGFFHTPLGLLAGAPAGQPLFGRLQRDGRVVGIAVGVRHTCRLSLKPKNAYFPSLPALVSSELRTGALRTLVAEMRREAVTDVVCDSLDAGRAAIGDGSPGTRRIEFRVPLDVTGVSQLGRFHPEHVRQLRHAAGAGWTLRLLGGDDARTMLAATQGDASDRALDHNVEPPPLANIAVPRLRESWGATVFAVINRSTPLAAALVGWANQRAYLISGGPAVEGYGMRAVLWMHWRIMAALGEAGFASYNLGGMPEGSAAPGHPEFGLFQLMQRFGASVRRCRGAHWTLHAA